MTKPKVGNRFTSSTRTGALSRIPGAGPTRDLFELLGEFGGPNECTECETPVVYADDTAEMTEAVIEFLRERGIELDR